MPANQTNADEVVQVVASVDDESATKKEVVVEISPSTTPGVSPPTATKESGPASAETSELESDPEYLKYLRALYAKWTDCPTLNITYYSLSHTFLVPKKKKEIITLPRAVINTAVDTFQTVRSLLRGTRGVESLKHLEKFSALHKVMGSIAPGTMTLVLAPPGHGKSMLLKAISGRLSGKDGFSGSILYNGMTAEECRARGIKVSRLCAYVAQQDFSFPTITVKETLQFAAQNAVPDIELLDSEDKSLKEMDERRAELLLNLVGLKECKDTILGNDMLRGVSGGQKKRVALAEMLLTNARVYCLDEVSTGLDAAVTKHIFTQLKEASKISKSSIVTALLQPTPETYELFDDVILMREGVVVYHGPRTEVNEWLQTCCGFRRPHNLDEAQFLLDVLSDPIQAHHTMIEYETNVKNALSTSVNLRKLNIQPKRERQESLMDSANFAHPVEHRLQSDSADNQYVYFHTNGGTEVSEKFAAEEKHGATQAVLQPLSAPSKPAAAAATEGTPLLALDTETMFYNFSHSTWYSRQALGGIRKVLDSDELDGTRWSQYTRTMFGSDYPHSMWRHLYYNFHRQIKVTFRDKAYIRSRIMQAVLMGFIFGTLFFKLGTNDYQSKFGLLQYAIMFASFANIGEVPLSVDAKNIVSKQIKAGFYNSTSYTLSLIAATLPIPLIETIIYSLFIYFIPDLASEAGRFIFFVLIVFAHSMVMGVFFRSISYLSPLADVANQLSMPFITLFIIFGGFLLPYDSVPGWLKWLYWLSPMSWAMRSLSLNEFKANKYDGFDSTVTTRLGDVYLSAFGIQTDDIFKWMGFVFAVGYFILFSILCIIILMKIEPITPLGTRRKVVHHQRLHAPKHSFKLGEDGHIQLTLQENDQTHEQQARHQQGKEETTKPAEVAIEMVPVKPKTDSVTAATGQTKGSSLPFAPATIAWKDLNYTVYLGKEKVPKQLLTSVNGFALPGEMTALMGASGAGKTTLMDVIAGRKTMGKIDGDILVNGQKVSNEDFQHLMGYVEQNDIHMGTSTVRESLEFSSKLRLPKSVTDDQRNAFIDEVMKLVGLTHVANRVVGDASTPGLSTGQLKLVTIAVELVANPSILFLDEPTSGLDAPAALRVMRAIRNIAGTGRTVVCTIHQPSAQLFYMFDRLLLLRSGGRTVYFSKLGKKACELVQYLESLDENISPIEIGVNPANWMLDVIGAAATGSQTLQFDFADRWEESALAAASRKELSTALESRSGVGGVAVHSNQREYVGWLDRYWEVQKRQFVSHWRNPAMNVTRFVLMVVLSLFFGVVYYDIGTSDFQGIQSKLSALFVGLSLPAAVCANSATPAYFRQRAVYYREKTAAMYDSVAYSTSIFLVELPYLAVSLLGFVLPFYWMINYAHDAGLFFRFYLMVYMSTLCYSFLSQLWLALLPNAVVENIINGLVMTLFFMFGGLFIRADSIPQGWKWFYYIDPVPKAFISLATTQFDCSGDTSNCPSLIVPGQGATTLSNYVSDAVSGNSGEYWKYFGYLMLELAVCRIFILVALRYISHIKR